nr:hypothetical protein [Algicella marina]
MHPSGDMPEPSNPARRPRQALLERASPSTQNPERLASEQSELLLLAQKCLFSGGDDSQLDQDTFRSEPGYFNSSPSGIGVTYPFSPNCLEDFQMFLQSHVVAGNFYDVAGVHSSFFQNTENLVESRINLLCGILSDYAVQRHAVETCQK